MRLLLAAFSVAALALVGCGGKSEGGRKDAGKQATAGEAAVPRSGPARIDVREGSYRGVALGDTKADLARVFGRPDERQSDEPITPLADENFRGPGSVPVPRGTHDRSGPPKAPATYRYEKVSFLADSRGEIFAFLVSEGRAATERRVAVGDRLARARKSYKLKCGTAVGSGDEDIYRACTGKVARRWVWFGGDPIANITVASVPLRF